MAGKAVDAVKSFFSKLSIRAPWKFTGVASTPEYLNYLPVATEYRTVAPGSQKLKAMVPAAEPDRIYNIKYYDRDTLTAGQVVGGTNKRHMVHGEVDMKTLLAKVEGPPPTAGQPFRWGTKTALLDVDNNGYT